MCCAVLDLPNAPFRMVLGNVKLTGSRAVAQPNVRKQNQFEVSCGLVVIGGKYVCPSCEKNTEVVLGIWGWVGKRLYERIRTKFIEKCWAGIRQVRWLAMCLATDTAQ
uniref:(northern house mosquito) hypothetical protein n=1 Tax=Culex pipiens TaxID=7175 RepID=A0A8D8MBZ4_CULPI